MEFRRRSVAETYREEKPSPAGGVRRGQQSGIAQGFNPGTPRSTLFPYTQLFRSETPKGSIIYGVPPPLRGGNLQRRKAISGGRIPPGRTPPERADRRHRHHHRHGHNRDHHQHHPHHQSALSPSPSHLISQLQLEL